MQDLPEHLWHKSFLFYVKEDATRKGGPNLRLLRLDPDRPSLTVTAYIFNKFVHPFEDRFITVREAARLQDFPDNIVFQGTLTSSQLQVGNAVPVRLGKAIFTEILQHLAKNSPEGIGIEIYTSGQIPALSLFAGAGGLDLGANLSTIDGLHWKTSLAVDSDMDCCETLRYNFKGDLEVMQADISHLSSSQLLDAIPLEKGVLPLIFGGPPCQSFSQAGKQKGTADLRGSLIYEFIRCVRELQPVYFVMENVANLRGINKGRLLDSIVREFEDSGYEVTQGVLCAADFGTPQLRKRFFLIGVRCGYPPVSFPMPTHSNEPGVLIQKPYVGVGQAFVGLPKIV